MSDTEKPEETSAPVAAAPAAEKKAPSTAEADMTKYKVRISFFSSSLPSKRGSEYAIALL